MIYNDARMDIEKDYFPPKNTEKTTIAQTASTEIYNRK